MNLQPNEINLTQTFLCLTSLQYVHAYSKTYILICFIQLAKRQENKESALVRCPLFPIFSKFCKQSKCHSKFKVSNSLQTVLIGPSIIKVILKFGKTVFFFQLEMIDLTIFQLKSPAKFYLPQKGKLYCIKKSITLWLELQ